MCNDDDDDDDVCVCVCVCIRSSSDGVIRDQVFCVYTMMMV